MLNLESHVSDFLTMTIIELWPVMTLSDLHNQLCNPHYNFFVTITTTIITTTTITYITMMAMSEARKLRGGRGSREDDEEFFCLSTEVNL